MNKLLRHPMLIVGFLALAAFIYWRKLPPPSPPEPHANTPQPPAPSALPLKANAPLPSMQPAHTLASIAKPQPESIPSPAPPTPTPVQTFVEVNSVLCEHIVSGESPEEFTGQIRLINKGKETIYGWSVEWSYPDGSTLLNSSGVALAGNNPYTGEYLENNAEIAPGERVTFSFTGIKGGDSAPRNIQVTGDICTQATKIQLKG